jgi:hypothetical protein
MGSPDCADRLGLEGVGGAGKHLHPANRTLSESPPAASECVGVLPAPDEETAVLGWQDCAPDCVQSLLVDAAVLDGLDIARDAVRRHERVGVKADQDLTGDQRQGKVLGAGLVLAISLQHGYSMRPGLVGGVVGAGVGDYDDLADQIARGGDRVQAPINGARLIVGGHQDGNGH